MPSNKLTLFSTEGQASMDTRMPQWTCSVYSPHPTEVPTPLSASSVQQRHSIYANSQYRTNEVSGEAFGQKKSPVAPSHLRTKAIFQEAIAHRDQITRDTNEKHTLSRTHPFPYGSTYDSFVPMSYSSVSSKTPSVSQEQRTRPQVFDLSYMYPHGLSSSALPLSVSSTPTTPTSYSSMEQPEDRSYSSINTSFLSLMNTPATRPYSPVALPAPMPSYTTPTFHSARLPWTPYTNDSFSYEHTHKLNTSLSMPTRVRPCPTPSTSSIATLTPTPTPTSPSAELGSEDESEEDQEDQETVTIDKRRRNTAASARFRIKKKLREQNLQRSASEMSEKAQRLESRVKELEKEIQWLKSLVVERNHVHFEQLLKNRPSHVKPIGRDSVG